MRQLDTLLVHPDPLVRQSLRRALRSVDFLRVLGEAVEADEAWHLLQALPYGVVFMGVHLGEGDHAEKGMDLARRILGQSRQGGQHCGAAVVFVADNEKDALEAFDLGATDYLVFPCPKTRLDRTLLRLKQFSRDFRLAPQQTLNTQNHIFDDYAGMQGQEELSTQDEGQILQLPLDSHTQDDFATALKKAWNAEMNASPELNKLSIALGGRTLLLPYDEITFIEADEDYSHVHTAENKYLTSYRLKNLEDRLRLHGFFRVHRKYLVNLQMVTELVSVASGNCLLRTAGRTRIELPISRRRLSELKQALGL